MVLKENPMRSPRFGTRGFVLLRFCNERSTSMISGNSAGGRPARLLFFGASVAEPMAVIPKQLRYQRLVFSRRSTGSVQSSHQLGLFNAMGSRSTQEYRAVTAFHMEADFNF